MLYYILKWMLKRTSDIFFKTVQITGSENIPKHGALMIVANHPSMFMDPVMIGLTTGRRVYFLAKGTLFQGKIANYVLPKLGLIPIHRMQDDSLQVGKNAGTFKKCFEHLENSGTILIFPEGTSITQRRLRPLKTGAAKIALGAESRNQDKTELHILVVGLHYEDQHKFNRNLLIQIQPPIDVRKFNQNASEVNKVAQLLTDEIRNKLEEVVISLPDEESDELIRYFEKLVKQAVISESNQLNEPYQDFKATKQIIATWNHLLANNPILAESLKKETTDYFFELKEKSWHDSWIKRQSHVINRIPILQPTIKLVVGFPIYIFGLINNYVPYIIPGLISDYVEDKDLKGSLAMLLGMFTFLLFYPIQIVLCQFLFHQWWITALYAISLPVTGFITHYYWQYFTELLLNISGNKALRKHKEEFAALLDKRNAIARKLALVMRDEGIMNSD